MLQFCLIWVECYRKYFINLLSFLRYKRILTREITSESSLRPPFWFRHLCCDVTSGISAHRKSKASLGPLQARVLSSFLQEYFLVLTMVKRCVVGSCNNSNKTGHSTHFFPKEERIRRQWINFVQVKRADFLEPTEHSIICGAHFANECFDDDGMVKMGFKDKRSYLKTSSVPTIQPQRPKALPEARKRTIKSEEKEIPATASQTPGKRSRTSRAVHKLSVSRVSKPM